MTTPNLEPGDLLTLQDCADRLTTGYRTVFRLVSDGHLRAHKVGGQWRVHRDDLAAYVFGGSLADSMRRHPAGQGLDAHLDALAERGSVCCGSTERRWVGSETDRPIVETIEHRPGCESAK